MTEKVILVIKRHIPTVLSCIGSAGVILTTVLAVKATPKAFELVRVESCAAHDGDPYAFTKSEAIQACWQCYIPTAIAGLSTIICIVGANLLNKQTQASLASAYALLHQSYRKYKTAAKSVYGEDANSKISVQMAKDAYVSAGGWALYSKEMDPASEKVLCYDEYSQRYFMATMAAVVNAQYHLNRNLSLRGYVSTNEFYEFLGLDKIDNGYEDYDSERCVGWSYDDLVDDGFMWLDFENACVETDDGVRCCVISAIMPPGLVCFE